MKGKSLLFTILTAIYLGVGGWMISQIIIHTQAYKNLKSIYTEALNYEKRLLDVDEWLDKSLGVEKKAKVQDVLIDSEKHYVLAQKVALWFLMLTIIYGILSFFFFNKIKTGNHKLLTGCLLVIALLCLIAGVCTPMLEIAAFEKDMVIPINIDTGLLGMKLNHTAEFSGEMFFYYQCKSIMELIQLLLTNGNFLVGISILLFSIFIPVIKLSLSAYLLMKDANAPGISKLVKHIGKWSMADVFVVAIFLGFLAFKNMQTGIQTDSNTLLGLYFFFAYCVISISSSFFINNKAVS
jgi:hypothetical protein